MNLNPSAYPDTDDIQSFVGEVRDFEDYHNPRIDYLSDALDAIHQAVEDDEIRPMIKFWDKYPNPQAADMNTSDGLGSQNPCNHATVQVINPKADHHA